MNLRDVSLSQPSLLLPSFNDDGVCLVCCFPSHLFLSLPQAEPDHSLLFSSLSSFGYKIVTLVRRSARRWRQKNSPTKQVLFLTRSTLIWLSKCLCIRLSVSICNRNVCPWLLTVLLRSLLHLLHPRLLLFPGRSLAGQHYSSQCRILPCCICVL